MNDRNDPGSPDEDRPFGARSDSDPGQDTGHGIDLDAEFDFDLSLVHADDEYLDRLGGANLDDPDGVPDDQLSALLMSWRRDIDAEPMDELVDPKLATVTVHAARVRRSRRPRLLVPMAAAAAVLAIAFAGLGLVARGAEPGETLWALTKVLYSDHARSVEAAEAVRDDLRQAEAALTAGRVAEAKTKLENARAVLPTVSTEDGQRDLEEQHASLMAHLPGNPSGEASSPPSPNPTTAPGPGSGTDGSESDSGTDDPGTDESSESTPPPDDPPDQTEPSTPPTTTTPTTPSTPRTEENPETPGDTEGGAPADIEGDPLGDTAAVQSVAP